VVNQNKARGRGVTVSIDGGEGGWRRGEEGGGQGGGGASGAPEGVRKKGGAGWAGRAAWAGGGREREKDGWDECCWAKRKS
jgi:hypothetical protein